MINLWLFSTKGVITKKRLAVASRLGFERLLICPTPDLKKIAKWCSELDLRVMPMLPDWGDIKKEHPELAFRNHYRMFSFDSEDPLVVPNSWPCFWAKEAIDLIRDQFPRCAEECGDALAGFVIGIGTEDASTMPVNWHRCENGGELCRDYWVFSDYALDAFEEMYGLGARPVAHPEEDTNLSTLNFIQTGMIKRMSEIAFLAAEHAPEVWAQILPFPDNSHLNMAAGYAFGFHRRLADWAHEFSAEYDVHTAFLMPHVFKDNVPNQVAQAGAMCDPQGLKCENGVCAEVSGSDWKQNLAENKKRAEELGLTVLLCDPIYVTDPKNEIEVANILSGEEPLAGVDVGEPIIEEETLREARTPCVECRKHKEQNPLDKNNKA